jgi:hypothetical protein
VTGSSLIAAFALAAIATAKSAASAIVLMSDSPGLTQLDCHASRLPARPSKPVVETYEDRSSAFSVADRCCDARAIALLRLTPTEVGFDIAE